MALAERVQTWKYDIIKWKVRYDLNREIARISDWSSNEILKSEYLTGKESKPNVESILWQNRFEYCSFGKTFETQIETT